MQKTKRVVTGLNEQGQATLLFNAYAENHMEINGWPGAYITELWVSNEMPVDNNGGEDRAARPIRHDPTSPGGTIFRIVEIPPEKNIREQINTDAAFEAMGSHNRPSSKDVEQHPSMHFTDSVDYLTVLSGEMHMLMEDGSEVLLQPGDCVVQKGTKHAWVNRGELPCVISAVLVDAKPIKN